MDTQDQLMLYSGLQVMVSGITAIDFCFILVLFPIFIFIQIPASDVEIDSELPCGFQIPSNLTSQ